jgi:hypothetical protein
MIFFICILGGKKKQLHVEKGADDFAITSTYDDADDYDFM